VIILNDVGGAGGFGVFGRFLKFPPFLPLFGFLIQDTSKLKFQFQFEQVLIHD
jgi:hypothetical protein